MEFSRLNILANFDCGMTVSVERSVVIFWPPIFNSMTSSRIDGDVSISDESSSGVSVADILVTSSSSSARVSLSALFELMTAVRMKIC